jgi:hypothetical protein
MQARSKSARRPRQQLPCRAFHPDPDELIRALSVAFGLAAPLPAPPPPPEPPLPPAARERVADDAS